MKAPPHRLLTFLIALTAMTVAGYLLLTDKNYVYQKLEGEIFSTHYQVTYQPNAALKLEPQEIQSAIDKELNRIDWIASSWKNESELSRYNQAANKEEFPLSNDLKWLIKRSREIELLTGGAFNIEHETGRLDLSGIAKGYAVDRIADYLAEDLGIESFLVDIGGEIKAKGVNSKGETWNVGIFIPPGHEAIKSPRVRLEKNSIATSGHYFKGSHITDPETSKAVTNSLISASVIHTSNTTADALATALYVMGSTKGLPWARDHQICAIFIIKDGTILSSSSLVVID
ncbi:MAG: thiamine biosynthesis lipoprotein [Cryomorphaceae bacterium]|jgi:thiamine biosynthesis lipoprotein